MASLHPDLASFLHGADEVLPPDELALRLAEGRPLRIKAGFDPTAPDLHLGHTLLLRKLRQFQDAGHEICFLVGDFTALIGDPTGRSTTRPPLTRDAVKANAETYVAQVGRVLDIERTRLLYNSEWIDGLRPDEWVRLTATYTVARMLERDDFQKRYGANQPIGLHELLYPLLQGYDSVAMRADVELGGTDQKFNLLVGRELQKHYGQRPQIVMTLPILEGLDGTQKMSKSLNNTIALTDTPDDMFGKLMSVSDPLMWRYLERLSDESEATLARWRADVAQGLNPREIKGRLAREITARFHGLAAAESADQAFVARFRAHAVPDEVPSYPLAIPGAGVALAQLLKQAGLVESTSEALRLAKGGGLRLDGERVADAGQILRPPLDTLVQLGKRRFARLALRPAGPDA